MDEEEVQVVPQVLCVQLPRKEEVKYVIRISPKGFYSRTKTWTEAPREDAHVFDTKKEASRQQNRLNGRLWKVGPGATVEPA